MKIRRTPLSMALLGLAAFSALQFAAAVSASASSSEVPNGRTSVTLESNGASHLAKVTLGDSARGMFVVDTGASHTIISPKMARKLRVGKKDGRSVGVQVADGDTLNGRVITVDEIRVGRASVYDSQVIILDEFAGTGLDGLLGMSFLGHFTFKIDAEEGKLILYEKD